MASYWSGDIPPNAGTTSYGLDSAAEARKQPHLQVAIWSEALYIIASEQDPLLAYMGILDGQIRGFRRDA